MAELDLTPTEPEVYDGEYYRATLRAEMKRLGHDYRDNPAVDRGIEQIRATRLQTSLGKKSFTAIDQHGEPLRGVAPLRRLAQELAAKIESEREPTLEEIAESKRGNPLYQL